MNANGASLPNQPVTRGANCSIRSLRTYSHAAPGPPHTYFTEPPHANDTPRSTTSIGTVPIDW